MKKLWLIIRSAILWTVSGMHFFIACMFVMLMAVFIDPRKNDRPQRIFFRNVLRLVGVRFETERAHGFDPSRTSLFICNHVNIFDPFVVYSAVPQFLRGFELESHFKIPVYGWLMGRFGNIPVPDKPNRANLEIMDQRARKALDSGISLIAFAEGSRTRDGHVGPFRKGIFVLAQRFAVPIVPVSILGSYEFFQTGNWILYPGKITVILHDTIEPSQVASMDPDDLRNLVHQIVSAPVEAAFSSATSNSPHAN
jgi:1-acyl-sn-glycerol-3-phosphate acyltransferase